MTINELKEAVSRSNMEGEAKAEIDDILEAYATMTGEEVTA